MHTSFEKLFISMRYWLLGAAQKDDTYYLALDALEYASEFHTGTRKDGTTPEFYHQLSIAHYVRSIIGTVIYPAETLAAVFLHDVCEDYGVGFEEIETRFGKRVAVAVELLTKKHRNKVKNIAEYLAAIANDPIASIVKGADRANNIQTMLGVFSMEKQKSYIEEVKVHFMVMLKQARRLFPQQEPCYENIKHVLLSQIMLYEALHDAKAS